MLRETATAYNFDLTKYQSTEFVQFCIRRTRIKHIHSKKNKATSLQQTLLIYTPDLPANVTSKLFIITAEGRWYHVQQDTSLNALIIVSAYKSCVTKEKEELLKLITQSRKQWIETDREKNCKVSQHTSAGNIYCRTLHNVLLSAIFTFKRRITKETAELSVVRVN